MQPCRSTATARAVSQAPDQELVLFEATQERRDLLRVGLGCTCHSQERQQGHSRHHLGNHPVLLLVGDKGLDRCGDEEEVEVGTAVEKRS